MYALFYILTKEFKETFERITLTVNNKILFYRIQGIEGN